MAIKRILLGSACMHLQKGQYTEAARLLDTSRRAISASTALAIDELDPEIPGQGPIFELRRGFLKARGPERSNGLFCKTLSAVIEAITHVRELQQRDTVCWELPSQRKTWLTYRAKQDG
jgi:hypothetical protein